MKSLTILCCGDRHWTDWATIRAALSDYTLPATVVHGNGRGADRMCGTVARELGYEVIAVPADWTRFGLRAGPVRNQLMLDRYPAIALVLAFHRDLERSKGTRDMMQRAFKAGIPTRHLTGL